MKYFKNYILIIVIGVLISCQQSRASKTSATDSDTICMNPDSTAVFCYGQDSLIRFFQDEFNYPDYCEKNRISDDLLIRFTVQKNGEITDIAFEDSSKKCTEFNSEAVRVLKNTGTWKPAIKANQRVKSRVLIPLKLSAED